MNHHFQPIQPYMYCDDPNCSGYGLKMLDNGNGVPVCPSSLHLRRKGVGK